MVSNYCKDAREAQYLLGEKMKKVSLLFMIFLSLTSYASQGCFEDLTMKSPLVEQLLDFGSDPKVDRLLSVNGIPQNEYNLCQCLGAIGQMLVLHGCNAKEIDRVVISQGVVSEINQDGCTVDTSAGIFQVMISWMAEPPIAVVLFSRWD